MPFRTYYRASRSLAYSWKIVIDSSILSDVMSTINHPAGLGHQYEARVISSSGGNIQLGDIYLTLDGRSLEAPALALALFRGLDKIIGDSYLPNGITQTSTFLAQSLRNQQAVFQQSLQSLLTSTLSEDEVKDLLEDWTNPRWKQDDLKNSIIARLGDGADEMLEAANGICKTLSKLIKRLPVGQSALNSRSQMLGMFKLKNLQLCLDTR